LRRSAINILQAEAAYAKQALADTDKLQEDLYKELRGRIQEADRTVPLRYAIAWLVELCHSEMPPNGLQFPKLCYPIGVSSYSFAQWDTDLAGNNNGSTDTSEVTTQPYKMEVHRPS